MSSYLSGPVGHKWTSPMHFDSTFLEMNIMKLLEFVLKNSYFTSEQDHYPQRWLCVGVSSKSHKH